MNASPVLRMALQHVTTPGRRLARHAVYPHPTARPPVRRRGAHRPPRADRLQADLPGPHPADDRLRRLRPADQPVRRRPRAPQGAVPGDRPQGPARQPPGDRRPRAPAQRRPAGHHPDPAGQPPPAGRRPDPHPVPRHPPRRPGRAVPRAGEVRDHPLPRLRHRLPDPARDPGHRRPDLRPAGGGLGRRPRAGAPDGPGGRGSPR